MNNDHHLHNEILNEMHDIYIKKNTDYGDSFSEQWKEYGLLSLIIRLDDKLRRLKQLYKNEALVRDESIRDTLMDAANYCTLGIMELDKRSKYKNEQVLPAPTETKTIFYEGEKFIKPEI
ncbi:DUF1599 domain-containing protein [Brevibacillus gelatini]|uniref:DUF1599 domain-containing protein n=1 Tax=Brevibacillus gelatini TaxID=1655277 RepID=A0A3M8B7P3_9BACL|nr:nucleotide modification associated domain-containing protein [Brevibacillus gelatini]RNB59399.1 DUF1599 domain-containing protein [Brevibacillus gelatini]